MNKGKEVQYDILPANLCKPDNHSWVKATLLFTGNNIEIPDLTPCDCGKKLWHVEVVCEHCGKTKFCPKDNPRAAAEAPLIQQLRESEIF